MKKSIINKQINSFTSSNSRSSNVVMIDNNINHPLNNNNKKIIVVNEDYTTGKYGKDFYSRDKVLNTSDNIQAHTISLKALRYLVENKLDTKEIVFDSTGDNINTHIKGEVSMICKFFSYSRQIDKFFPGSFKLSNEELHEFVDAVLLNQSNHNLTKFALVDNPIKHEGIKALTTLIQRTKTINFLYITQSIDNSKSSLITMGKSSSFNNKDYNESNTNKINETVEAKETIETNNINEIEIIDNIIITSNTDKDENKNNQEHNDNTKNYQTQSIEKLTSLMLLQISGNRSIIQLNLNHNKINNSNVKYLCIALVNNITLKKLSLTYNNIQNNGMIDLFMSLKLNRTLEILDLSYNQIDNTGLVFLAKLLFYNINIKDILLQFCCCIESTNYNIGLKRLYILLRQKNNMSQIRLIDLDNLFSEEMNAVINDLQQLGFVNIDKA